MIFFYFLSFLTHCLLTLFMNPNLEMTQNTFIPSSLCDMELNNFLLELFKILLKFKSVTHIFLCSSQCKMHTLRADIDCIRKRRGYICAPPFSYKIIKMRNSILQKCGFILKDFLNKIWNENLLQYIIESIYNTMLNK